jgi:hypothetical protein
MNRVEGLLQAVERFYPEFKVPVPTLIRSGTVTAHARRMDFPTSAKQKNGKTW